MKYLAIGLFLLLFTNHSFGQGCGLVSGMKDKKTGIETRGGVINSKDFYSLVIQKEIDTNYTSNSLNYSISLIAASRVMLADSLLQTKGKFELHLTNGRTIVWENATCFNDPLGMGNSVGFNVEIAEDQIREILNQSITKIKVFGILETEFSTKKQKQQQKIVSCLING